MPRAVAACTIYGVAGRLIFNTEGWATGPNAWMARPFFEHCSDAAEPAEIGRALLDALAASSPKVRGEDDGEATLLALAGVRSYRQLTRRARLTLVRLHDGRVYELIPCAPARPGEAWQGASHGTQLHDPTVEELGRAVLEAMAQSPTYDEAHPKDQR